MGPFAMRLKTLAMLACLVAAGMVALLFVLHHGKPDPQAKPRTDFMIKALRADGWTVVEAKKFGDMQGAIANLETDTSSLHAKVRDLLDAAKTAHGEVRAVAEFNAEAETALNLSGKAFRADSLLRLEPSYADLPGDPDSVVADFADGVFSGHVAYKPTPMEFSMQLRADIAAALAITQAADGRTLFSVVPRDPRVTISLDRALYSPPAPVRVCSVGERARWGTLGVLAGAAAVALR